MKLTPEAIPTFDLVAEEDGKLKLSYILFLQQLIQGDTGTLWTPIPTNLTISGTPTITGAYYTNQGWTDFWITIVPGTSTTSTVGSTYFSLPFDVKVDGGCFAVSGGTGAVGMIVAASDRVYPPAWSAVTVPLTITGRVKT